MDKIKASQIERYNMLAFFEKARTAQNGLI